MPDSSAIALHGEATSVQPNPRPITIEDAVMNQIDRIGYLRSIGEEWKEPVFHLRDTLVGLEDEEFWDGIPMNLRGKKEQISEEDLEEYKDRGWQTIKVQNRIIKKDGRSIEYLDPLPEELSKMLRILMALLARRGMTWRKRNVDEIPLTFGVQGVETTSGGESDA